MKQYAVLVDEDRCVGCQACEVACKQENSLPAGLKWRTVISSIQEVDGKLVMSFPHIRCMHCANPPCVPSCPTNAITKRADGIVLIDSEPCIGCMVCIEVCPFGAPQLNPDKGVVGMCTLCVHRIERGLEPACVEHCPAEALVFGDINDVTSMLSKRRAQLVAARRA